MGDELRESRILDAANRLITHYGYDKTTVDDIAREAGVSKGAIYLHFKSKEALFEALVLRETDSVINDMFTRIEADPEGGTLFHVYTHALHAAFTNPLIRALSTQDRRVLGDFSRRFARTITHQGGMLFGRELIRQMQDAGLIRRDLTPEAIMHLLAYIRFGFLMVENALPPEHTPPLDDIIDAMAAMLSKGLGTEGGDSDTGKAIVRTYIAQMRTLIDQRREQTKQQGGN